MFTRTGDRFGLNEQRIGKSQFRDKDGKGLYLRVDRQGSISSVTSAEADKQRELTDTEGISEGPINDKENLTIQRKKSQAAINAPELVMESDKNDDHTTTKDRRIPPALRIGNAREANAAKTKQPENARRIEITETGNINSDHNEKAAIIATSYDIQSPTRRNKKKVRRSALKGNIVERPSSIQNTPKIRQESSSDSDLKLELSELRTEIRGLDVENHDGKFEEIWNRKTYSSE